MQTLSFQFMHKKSNFQVLSGCECFNFIIYVWQIYQENHWNRIAAVVLENFAKSFRFQCRRVERVPYTYHIFKAFFIRYWVVAYIKFAAWFPKCLNVRIRRHLSSPVFAQLSYAFVMVLKLIVPYRFVDKARRHLKMFWKLNI